MDLSLELREARERAGLSREEVSSRLNVQLRYIEALEHDYRGLPSGTDRDTVVRAYAREIGVDPDDVIARTHAEDDGTAELWVPGHVAVDEFPKEADLRSSVPTEAARVAAPPPGPRSVEHSDVGRTVTSGEPDLVSAAPVPAAPDVFPRPRIPDDAADLPLTPRNSVEVPELPLSPPVAVRRAESVVREPADLRGERAVITVASAGPGRRRGLAVVAGALMVIVLAIFLGAYVYERTRLTPADTPDAAGAASDATVADRRTGARAPADAGGDGAQAATTGDLPRADATTRDSDAPPAPASVVEPTTPAVPPPAPAATVPPATAVTSPQAPPTAPPQASPPAPPTVPPQAPETVRPPSTDEQQAALGARGSEPSPRATPPAAPADDLSGTWTLVTRVESSLIPSFQGLELGYRIHFAQKGNAIEGVGQKVSENGGRLSATAQTPIVLSGTIDGDRLTLTFTEDGTRRRSAGRLVLVREDGAAWRGRFSSDAARSTGTALARRAE